MRSRLSTAPSWLPFAAILAPAAYLALRWNSIPARWVSHWGRHGTPDGWSERSAGAVFGPFLIAVLLIAVFEGIGAIVRARGRSRPGGEALATATTSLLRWVLTAAVGTVSALAATLPFGVERPALFAALGALALVLAIVLGARGIVRATRVLAQEQQLPGYESGLFYRNPNDPRLWVPKLVGIGTTLNFAHRWAWPTLLALIFAPLALVLYIVVLSG